MSALSNISALRDTYAERFKFTGMRGAGALNARDVLEAQHEQAVGVSQREWASRYGLQVVERHRPRGEDAVVVRAAQPAGSA